MLNLIKNHILFVTLFSFVGCTASVKSNSKIENHKKAVNTFNEKLLVEAFYEPNAIVKPRKNLFGTTKESEIINNFKNYREVSLTNTTKRILKEEGIFADVFSEQTEFEKIKYKRIHDKKLVITYKELERDQSFANGFLRGITLGAVSDVKKLNVEIKFELFDKNNKSLSQTIYKDILTEKFRGGCSKHGCAPPPIKNFWRMKNVIYEAHLKKFIRTYAGY